MGNRKLADEFLSSKTTCEMALRYFHLQILPFFVGISLVGCGSRGVPEPIKVLENPTNGERARFFREISYKVPKDYSETKHLAKWSDTQDKAGFTREITLEDDRESLAELRKTNLAARPK